MEAFVVIPFQIHLEIVTLELALLQSCKYFHSVTRAAENLIASVHGQLRVLEYLCRAFLETIAWVRRFSGCHGWCGASASEKPSPSCFPTWTTSTSGFLTAAMVSKPAAISASRAPHSRPTGCLMPRFMGR